MSTDLEACIALTQDLIRARSLPGREEPAARVLKAALEQASFDDVHIDEVGNVIGLLRGEGTAPAVMFNTHLDHVDVGDEARWPHPPHDATIEGGRIWGRGAVDIKGPMAAQVTGVARVAASGVRPPGDIYVTGVVQEEIGGVGARHLAKHLDVELVVVGEPSSNRVRRGHRGRAELEVHIAGKSCHASAPEVGANPLPPLGFFLTLLDNVPPQPHDVLGPSTLAPTLLRTDQTSANVVPGDVWLTLDVRYVPGQDLEALRAELESHLRKACTWNVGTQGTVSVRSFVRETWTGVRADIPAANPPYLLDDDDPFARRAQEIVAEQLHETVDEKAPGVWNFATDGGHFAAAGMRPVGFGPGDEALAHTIDEHIEIDHLEAAVRINEQLAVRLPLAGAS